MKFTLLFFILIQSTINAFFIPKTTTRTTSFHPWIGKLTKQRTSISSSSLLASSPTTSTSENEITPTTPTTPTPPTTSPKAGDIVTVTYSLAPDGDFIPEPLFDCNTTISFVLHGGNYLPGLHQLIEKMTPTTSSSSEMTKTTLDAGWGERRSELIAIISKSESGLEDDHHKQIVVGTELYLANGGKCIVTEVTEDTFTIDANPPLAGASYTAMVSLDNVQPGPMPSAFIYNPDNSNNVDNDGDDGDAASESKYKVATIALGCFWGGELEYMRLPGIVGTKVGYTQGQIEHPTYKQVCSGSTGHTEAIQLIYDPSIITYEAIVRTGLERLGNSRYTLNQVGNDCGTQYRHGIYYHDNEQCAVARRVLDTYGDGCVTECKEATIFYDAEDYHQQYLLKGGQSARKGATENIRCYG